MVVKSKEETATKSLFAETRRSQSKSTNNYGSIATKDDDELEGENKSTILTQKYHPLLPEEAIRSSNAQNIWQTLVVACCVGLVAGSLYGFGRYAKDLRDALEISQTDVQRFGILMDGGNYVGHPVTGLFYDRYGPKASCVVAAIMVLVSYGTLHWGVVTAGADAPLEWMDFAFVGVGLGSGLGYIAGLGTTTNLFRSTPHLGRAVGLVAAGYGFSSTLVALAYQHVHLQHFFLIWALLFAMTNLVGALVFNSTSNPHHQHPAKQNLTTTNTNNNDSDNSPAASWTTWKRLDFWLLFLSFACITGCGLVIINNISTMVHSIGGSDSLAGALVITLSISNVLGRIGMGSLADHHAAWHKLHLYRFASLMMFVAMLLSIVPVGEETVRLTLTVVLAAVAYGGSWVLIIGILADFYGKQHFGKDYGLIAMGPAVSGMIFNSLSATFYEQHVELGGDTRNCVGSVCYRNSFVMTATSAMAGYLVLLWVRRNVSSSPRDDDSQQPFDSVRISQILQEGLEV